MAQWRTMKSQKLHEKLENTNSKELFKWLAMIMAFGIGITAAVFIFYFLNFNEGLSTEHERWGTFGDFVGGTLNPILSFLGLLALLLTVVLQNRQVEISSNELELSRKELKATREELQRSANSQEKTEVAQVKQAKALEISAKISAITKLLDHETKIMEASWASHEAKQNARNKNINLQQELQELYEELKSLNSVK